MPCLLQATSSGLRGRFLSVRVTPPSDYPKSPPTIKFVSKVNLPGIVDASGNVRLLRFRPRASAVAAADILNVSDWCNTPLLVIAGRDRQLRVGPVLGSLQVNG
jgi:ubiquitin-protein ligase